MEQINLIAAHDCNRVIGHENVMPWAGSMPADMKRFKELTTGSAILMGRRTHESIGQPLPDRRNIVLTTQVDLEIEGCEVIHSLEELSALNIQDELFVIGGAKIYHLTMPYADKLFITEIDAEFPGDTYFPQLSGEWQEVSREAYYSDEHNDHNYKFLVYERIR